MHKVFISYGTCDRKTADSLCSFLENRDIPCWIAPRDISSGNYAGEITRALRAADIVIILCSKESCRSEHVKNEVSIAFNHAKLLLPYCLEDNPFDDDLEYYLSSKQRISASGDSWKDFGLLEGIIRDFRGDADKQLPQVPPKKKSSSRKLILPVVFGISLLAGGILYYVNRSSPQESVSENMADSTVIGEPVLGAIPVAEEQTARTEPSNKPPQPASHPQNDTFTGTVINGYPDGAGIYTYSKERRIDMHDPEGRVAAAGDYIDGNWTQGHLNYGQWFGADGTNKGFILLGDYPDSEQDQTLGKCKQR